METPKLSVLPYNGTRVFYPRDMKLRNWFYGVIRQSLENACFEEYEGPMLESLDLYAAKSGEELARSRPITLPTAAGATLPSALK